MRISALHFVSKILAAFLLFTMVIAWPQATFVYAYGDGGDSSGGGNNGGGGPDYGGSTADLSGGPQGGNIGGADQQDFGGYGTPSETPADAPADTAPADADSGKSVFGGMMDAIGGFFGGLFGGRDSLDGNKGGLDMSDNAKTDMGYDTTVSMSDDRGFFGGFMDGFLSVGVIGTISSIAAGKDLSPAQAALSGLGLVGSLIGGVMEGLSAIGVHGTIDAPTNEYGGGSSSGGSSGGPGSDSTSGGDGSGSPSTEAVLANTVVSTSGLETEMTCPYSYTYVPQIKQCISNNYVSCASAGHPELVCPTGQICTTSGSCQSPTGGRCVGSRGSSCASAANSCGMVNTGTVLCDGSCPAIVPGDEECPPPQITLTEAPSLVNPGNTCIVSWGVEHATLCDLSSDVGDVVSGVKLPSGSHESPALQTKTTYTLTCHNGRVVTNSLTVTCNLNPHYQDI